MFELQRFIHGMEHFHTIIDRKYNISILEHGRSFNTGVLCILNNLFLSFFSGAVQMNRVLLHCT